MRWIIALIFTLLVSSNLHALGKKPAKNKLSFHMEGHKAEGSKMTFRQEVYGKQIDFNRSPAIYTKELKSFKPFMAKDGSYGATFYLSKVAGRRLEALTTQNQKSWLLAVFNGRPLDAVFVDQPVRDARIVVWQGISKTGLFRFDLMMPRKGETKEEWKGRKKLVKKELKELIKKAKK